MRTRLIPRLAALLALAFAAGCTGDAASGGSARPRVEVGAPVPSYVSTSLEGDSVSLAALRGSPVLLNVWATWCHPCREEIPVLQGLHDRYGARGLKLIGVSVDAQGEEAAIRGFAREFRMTYPIWHDPNERVSTTFLVIGVPATFLIGKDGTLLWRRTGPVHANDTSLVKAIEGAL